MDRGKFRGGICEETERTGEGNGPLRYGYASAVSILCAYAVCRVRSGLWLRSLWLNRQNPARSHRRRSSVRTRRPFASRSGREKRKRPQRPWNPRRKDPPPLCILRRWGIPRPKNPQRGNPRSWTPRPRNLLVTRQQRSETPQWGTPYSWIPSRGNSTPMSPRPGSLGQSVRQSAGLLKQNLGPTKVQNALIWMAKDCSPVHIPVTLENESFQFHYTASVIYTACEMWGIFYRIELE